MPVTLHYHESSVRTNSIILGVHIVVMPFLLRFVYAKVCYCHNVFIAVQ